MHLLDHSERVTVRGSGSSGRDLWTDATACRNSFDAQLAWTACLDASSSVCSHFMISRSKSKEELHRGWGAEANCQQQTEASR